MFLQGIASTFYFFNINLNKENDENFFFYSLLFLGGGILWGLSIGLFAGVLASTPKTVNIFIALMG